MFDMDTSQQISQSEPQEICSSQTTTIDQVDFVNHQRAVSSAGTNQILSAIRESDHPHLDTLNILFLLILVDHQLKEMVKNLDNLQKKWSEDKKSLSDVVIGRKEFKE